MEPKNMSGYVDCPCCSTIHITPDGRSALCDECAAADCQPNREGAFDDCQADRDDDPEEYTQRNYDDLGRAL